ncbi:B12-binding domain-containing protein [Methanolobus chelungpuianus]|uniref:B12-binding domain-containing protein n=1 Tax=Methanolobus chelungpuianus TaxID=502115 RepID=UPI002114E17B|nr:B12-binding domain-containing protein [Methanolobus chelungpuianus]
MNSTETGIFDKAKHAVIDLDVQAVERIAREALETGINPVDLIEQGFIAGMKQLGDHFEAGETHISRILEAYQVMETGIDVLRPAILSSEKEVSWYGNLIVESEDFSTHQGELYVTNELPHPYCC